MKSVWLVYSFFISDFSKCKNIDYGKGSSILYPKQEGGPTSLLIDYYVYKDYLYTLFFLHFGPYCL